MATARAIASGNWSATGTWNGGVLPGNGDTVYSNGFTVTIDQNVDIGGANNPIVNAGSFVSGQWYEITTSGTTTFTSIGAAANTVGTIFQASGVGSGSGQARARATLTTATNTPAGATTGGGNFTMSTGYNITTDLRPGTSHCLTVTGGSVTLSNLVLVQSSSTNANNLNNSGSGTITFDACNITLTSASQSFIASNSGTGSLHLRNGSSLICPSVFGSGVTNSSVSGSVVCDLITMTGGGNSGSPITNSNTGSVTISNSIITGGGSACFGVNNTSSGTVTISNSTINGGSTNVAVQNAAAGTLICTNCTFTAIASVAAISSTNASATNRFSGSFISSVNGTQPINAPKWILGAQPLNAYIQHARDGVTANSFDRYYTSDNSTALNQAAPTDVRSGVVYGIGASQTGRLTVPARGSVALSVNYGPSMPFTATRSGTTATATLAYSYPLVVGDTITVTGSSNSEWNSTYTIASVVSGTSVTFVVPNTHSATAGTGANMQTTGTAVLDPAAVASAVWGAASRTITGGVVDTLTNAPSVPSASAIASQVRAELGTELGRIDAAISSRLAPSGTLATVTTLTNAPSVPTPSQIASQVRTELSTELGRIDAPVSGATAPSASTVATAVRTELATELARVDQNISSRLASSAYTAPANSDITAIKSKTDNLPASPAATGDIPSANIAAIKAKTDLLNTDRLAQCSTVSTTGAQLAAALS